PCEATPRSASDQTDRTLGPEKTEWSGRYTFDKSSDPRPAKLPPNHKQLGHGAGTRSGQQAQCLPLKFHSQLALRRTDATSSSFSASLQQLPQVENSSSDISCSLRYLLGDASNLSISHSLYS